MAGHAIKKKGEPNSPFSEKLAEWTGLEPATPGVTGRYSNQLNYHSKTYRLAFSVQRLATSTLPTQAVVLPSNTHSKLSTPNAQRHSGWWVLQGSNL